MSIAMLEGILPKAPLNKYGYSQAMNPKWSKPVLNYIDPEKELRAKATAWNIGTESLEDFAKQVGKSRKDLLNEKRMDIELAMSIAKELREAYGEDIGFRDVISTSIPGSTVGSKLPPEQEVSNNEDD
jgi:hypothetical protein